MGPGPAAEPAGGTVLQAAAGTEPQWLPGLNCGRRSAPAPAAAAAAAGQAAAAAGRAADTSACRPLSRRRRARWKPGRNSTVTAQAGPVSNRGASGTYMSSFSAQGTRLSHA